MLGSDEEEAYESDDWVGVRYLGDGEEEEYEEGSMDEECEEDGDDDGGKEWGAEDETVSTLEFDVGSGLEVCKRQRTECDKDARISKLEHENEVLRLENNELKEKVFKEILKVQQGQQAITRSFSALSGFSCGLVPGQPGSSSNSNSSHVLHGLCLKQVFIADGIEYASIKDITAPNIFSSPGSFPHAILVDRKSNERVNEVLMTRKITMRFRLVHKLDGRRVQTAQI